MAFYVVDDKEADASLQQNEKWIRAKHALSDYDSIRISIVANISLIYANRSLVA